MSEFIYAAGALPSKTTKNEVPGGEDVTKWWRAVDYTVVKTALLDTRNAILAGQFHGLAAQEARPSGLDSEHPGQYADADGLPVWWDGAAETSMLGGGISEEDLATVLADYALLTDLLGLSASNVKDLARDYGAEPGMGNDIGPALQAFFDDCEAGLRASSDPGRGALPLQPR